MSDALRNIFCQLDSKSLDQAEHVSRTWQQVIASECIWKLVPKKTVSKSIELLIGSCPERIIVLKIQNG
jgi:hypothetical protein